MTLDLTLITENFTREEVKATGAGALGSRRGDSGSSQPVTLTLDRTERWNAPGLRKLAAMLQGVPGMLTQEERK
jgi:hypothetical protein